MRHDPHRGAKNGKVLENLRTGIRPNRFQVVPFRMPDNLNLLRAINFGVTRHGKARAVNSAFFDARFHVLVRAMLHHLQIFAVADKKVPHREAFPVQDLDVI